MTTAQTIDKLTKMKLLGFIEALDEQRISTQYTELSFDERLSFLVDREYIRRENNKMKRRLASAKLKQRGTIEDVTFDSKRNLDKSQVMQLSQCQWIHEHHNLTITGATGVGKTFLACAFADKACKLGITSLYIKTSELVSQLQLAQAEGGFFKLIQRLAKVKLIVLDEWLRDPLTQQSTRDLLDLLDERYQRASTLFVSQVPVEDWHSQIKDPTVADALLDRVVHNSHRIKLNGESRRKPTFLPQESSLRSVEELQPSY